MSLAKDNIWKLLAPLVVMGVMFLIPVPDGMPPQAWHYFAVFVAMIVGMILEPIPATAISFIAVTICVIGSNYLLFDAGSDSNLLIVFYVQIMPDDLVMQLHRF